MRHSENRHGFTVWRMIISAAALGLVISIGLPVANRMKGNAPGPEVITVQGMRLQRLGDNAFNRIVWNRDSTRIAFSSSVNPSVGQIALRLLTRTDKRYPRDMFIFRSWTASLGDRGRWNLHQMPNGLMVDSFANSGSQVAGTMFRGVDLPRTPVRHLIPQDETMSIQGGKDISFSGYSPDEERLLLVDESGNDSQIKIVRLSTGQSLTAGLPADYAYWRYDDTIIGLRTSGPRFERKLEGVWISDNSGKILRSRTFDLYLGPVVRIGLVRNDRLAIFSRPIKGSDRIVGFILEIDSLAMEPSIQMQPGIVDVRLSRNAAFYGLGRARDNITSIHKLDFKTAKSEPMIQLEKAPLSAADTFSVSPDGRWLVVQAGYKDRGRGLYITDIKSKRAP